METKVFMIKTIFEIKAKYEIAYFMVIVLVS